VNDSYPSANQLRKACLWLSEFKKEIKKEGEGERERERERGRGDRERK